MFEHSIKVPRHYKIAANIIKKVSTEGGSVKSLLYDSKLRHFKTNVLFALITETIKHAVDIDKIFESCGILKNEPRLDPWVAKVLTTELLFGKKTLPGKSKPEQTILSYKDQFERYRDNHEDDLKVEVIRRPRYVRINTNLLTTSDAIRAFQDEGYRFIRCTSGSYDEYLKQIQSLTEEDFTQDYHVKTVFVFAAGTKLHEHELYLENKIILQDKATTLAVHLLAPPVGSTVLDMCAAPGMKTTQLAAYMKNQGKVYAIERNEKRYQTLCEFVEKTGSTCVEAINKDSLEIKRGDYNDVEYILLDPSCSGSGMELSVHNYIDPTRLAKLTSLQEKFLKHAMNSFPNAKRIVYSTCSLYPEENERVITNVVKTSRAKWRVQDAKELMKGNWNNFGSGMYGSIGYRCLYARLDSDLTTGFFLAVLDRDQKDMEKQQQRVDNEKGNASPVVDEGNEIGKRNKKKHKNDNTECESVENSIVTGDNEADDVAVEKSKNKKKKYKQDLEQETIEHSIANGNDDEADDVETKKSRKKKKNIKPDIEQETMEHFIFNGNDDEADDVETKKSRKKKKYNKHDNIEQETIEHSFENGDGNETDDDEIKKSRKKKKRNKQDSNEEFEEKQNSEIVQINKKKKSKEVADIENDALIETCNYENIVSVISKKSKKKKAKEELIEDISLESSKLQMRIESNKREHQDSVIPIELDNSTAKHNKKIKKKS